MHVCFEWSLALFELITGSIIHLPGGHALHNKSRAGTVTTTSSASKCFPRPTACAPLEMCKTSTPERAKLSATRTSKDALACRVKWVKAGGQLNQCEAGIGHAPKLHPQEKHR